MEARSHRVAAARGDQPLDLLIENVRLVNLYTREIYQIDIGISGAYIVFAGPGSWTGPAPKKKWDGQSRYAVPGLIDTHIHIESSMVNPRNFAAAVLPHGTTTVMIDPHEIGNVLGLRGVRYMLEASEDLPLKVFVQAPSCVPAVPQLETAGANFGAKEVATMLGWERVVGLAEVMDYVGVVQQNDRMREIVDAAFQRDVIISGHCPALRGRDLSAYMVGGPISDHEGSTYDELLEKLRLGMTVEAKVSSFSESISILARITRDLGTVPPNLVMCTDDVHPDDLLHKGHLDRVVRSAIAAGIPAIDAIRAATWHAALRTRQHELGAIAPGKRADLLLVTDLNTFTVDEVFVDGQLVAEKGNLVIALPNTAFAVEKENTVHLPSRPTPEDFILRAPPGKETATARVMTIGPDYGRRLETVTLPARDGSVDISDAPDLCLASVIERHGRTQNHSLVLVKGIGIWAGAVATTVAHDSHNLLVVGRDVADMALAANALADSGGGICCARAGQIAALLPLPIAGLMSAEPVETLVPQMEALNAALRKLGLPEKNPISPIIALALPVIPDYSVTDLGLVDVNAQRVIPIWVDES
ncbi:MAG: adenine deaminase [Anaerolineae bacterium]|nr:adenine deaminase [Anaerolineae bacterium]